VQGGIKKRLTSYFRYLALKRFEAQWMGDFCVVSYLPSVFMKRKYKNKHETQA
jgi:hypothetical protein